MRPGRKVLGRAGRDGTPGPAPVPEVRRGGGGAVGLPRPRPVPVPGGGAGGGGADAEPRRGQRRYRPGSRGGGGEPPVLGVPAGSGGTGGRRPGAPQRSPYRPGPVAARGGVSRSRVAPGAVRGSPSPPPCAGPSAARGGGGGVGPVFAVSFSAPAPALCSVPGDSSRSGQLRPLPALRRGGSGRGGGARPSGAWVWPPGLAGCCCGAALWPGLRFTPGETSLPAPRGRLPFWEVKRCWRDPRLLQPKMLLHPGRGNGDQPLPASGASCPLQPRPQAGRGGMWA